MSKAKIDKVTDRVLYKIEEDFVGGRGYDGGYSELADEIAELIKRHFRASLRESLKTELDSIRREIRNEFQGVKSENAQLKAQLEFYRGIEEAAKKKVEPT